MMRMGIPTVTVIASMVFSSLPSPGSSIHESTAFRQSFSQSLLARRVRKLERGVRASRTRTCPGRGARSSVGSRRSTRWCRSYATAPGCSRSPVRAAPATRGWRSKRRQSWCLSSRPASSGSSRVPAVAASCQLGGLPESGAEVVQIEVAAAILIPVRLRLVSQRCRRQAPSLSPLLQL